MIKICAVSKTNYQRGTAVARWFELPESFDGISDDLNLEEGNEDEDLLIIDYEAPFKLDMSTPFNTLTEYAERLGDLPDYLVRDMKELIGDGYESVEDLLDDPDRFTFVQDVTTDKQLGQYLVEEALWYAIPSALKPYIDERLYGQDYRFSSDVIYTQSGAYIR